LTARLSVKVPASAVGDRADRFVADASGLSRSYVQRLIAAGHLTADGLPLRASSTLEAGTRLELDVPEVAPVEDLREAIPLHVVYEDADLIIVDKPAGLVTHPAPGHANGTLVDALLAREAGALGSLGGKQRPGIVHRLDRDTSGLLLVARHDAAQAYLQAALKARRVKKSYLALVHGSVAAQLGRIEAPIGRDLRHRTRMAVVAEGRPSVTGYRVRERFASWTLLELDLITGRTHQIRVHLASIGHPVAGDPLYGTGLSRRGPETLARLFLHAWKLELAAPDGDRMIRAEAPLPEVLARVLESLRAEGGR